MVDLILVRTVNNPIPGVKKNSDSGSYAGCRIPPFGILNIANFVRMKGYSVKLVDLSKKCYASLTSDGIAESPYNWNLLYDLPINECYVTWRRFDAKI